MRRPDLEVRIVDDEAVILDMVNGQVHRLNATATRIWHDCDGTQSPADMAANLAASFELSPDDVMRDVMETISNLEQLGLLMTSTESGSVESA